MARLALLTTECAQLGDTVTELVRRHRDQLALVVTSDIYRPARGGPVRQTWRHVRRSGPAFVGYLLCSFLAYPALIVADRVAGWLTGRRHRYSVAELCRRSGIRHLHTADVNDVEVLSALRAEGVDLVIVYWFDQILSEDFIATPKLGVLNVHASHLPHCRGLFPVLFTALEPGTPFGVSVHRIIDREIDAGPLIAQTVVPLPPGRSIIYWDAYLNRRGVELLDEVLAGRRLDGRAVSGGSYHSYPDVREVRALRGTGVRLATTRDLLAVALGSTLPTSTATATTS